MKDFVKKQLTSLAIVLSEKENEFINDFVTMSADSMFTAENAKKIVDFFTNPENHKIGSIEVVDGLKINVDWTTLKEEQEVFPEIHKRFHDIHIPTFTEGIFVLSARDNLPVNIPFDSNRDIGFYEKPQGIVASRIPKNSWKFIPAGVFHGPLYGGFEQSAENYYEDKKVVKICIKISADR